MGIGFIVTILLLAALLGLFSKQVLSSGDNSRSSTSVPDMNEPDFDMMEEYSIDEYTMVNHKDNQTAGHHPHAM